MSCCEAMRSGRKDVREEVKWRRNGKSAMSKRALEVQPLVGGQNDDHRGGETARTLPFAGQDPRLREARLRSLPAEHDQGHQPSFARPGGRRGGLRRRDAEGRQVVLHLSRPRAHARSRRLDGGHARRADAARHRSDARQGRLDASDLGRARRVGLLRDHRRASADRLRRRLGARNISARRTCRSASSAMAPPISARSTRR